MPVVSTPVWLVLVEGIILIVVIVHLLQRCQMSM